MITERQSIRWNDARRLIVEKVDKLSINHNVVHITHMSIALSYTLLLFRPTGKLTTYVQPVWITSFSASDDLRQNISILLVEMGMKECIVRVPRIEKHSYLMSLLQKLNIYFFCNLPCWKTRRMYSIVNILQSLVEQFLFRITKYIKEKKTHTRNAHTQGSFFCHTHSYVSSLVSECTYLSVCSLESV